MKILYVTTVSGTMTFFTEHIKMLISKGHQVDLCCSVGKPINIELLELGCEVFDLKFKRTPLKIENYKAYLDLKQLIIEGNYDLVHTHTPIASALVRIACRKLDNVKVFYTAHGFHFFKGAPLINWLTYYPIEKWLSKYTDTIITINKEDYERAKNHFKVARVEYIPGVGLDIDKFRNVVVDRIAKRKEIGIPEDSFVVLSVGELNKNKNHEVIIKAIAKLNNPKIHYVICGKGPLENYLKELAEQLNNKNQVHLLGYRNDIVEICTSCDIFAFPSLREGLGMAALEAMACGLPIITSNTHGIVDYSINGVTGCTCSPKNVDSFAVAIDRLFRSDEMRIKMGKYNSDAVKTYDWNNVKVLIKDIYKIQK